MTARSSVAVAAGALLVGVGWVLFLRLDRDEAAEEAVVGVRQAAGHRRMLDLLEGVAASTTRDNHWLGDGFARVARRRLEGLPVSAPPIARFRLLSDVARHELRLGNETEAIRRYREAYDLLPRLTGSITEDEANRTIFRLPEAPCQLFRNEGVGPDGRVTFTDVARQAGVDNQSFVKGTIWGDFDNDRFPDLYVSTLGGPNRLYHNNRDGTFSDVARELGVEKPMASFPVWFFDFDNDGNLDLYTPTYRGVVDGVAVVAASYFGLEIPWERPRLYQGNGRGGFRDVASELGLRRFHQAMGANFGDVDNDGYLDFYLGTGYPDYEALMPNVMYRNLGGRGFVDVTLDGGFGHLQKGHAIAFADFDHDGDLDVFAQMGGAYPGDRFADALFENPGFGNHWIAIRLIGRETNRAAIGARLHLRVEENGIRRSIYRHVNSGGSFGSNPLRQTIGLGRASSIDRLEVYWPTTDRTQVFDQVEVDGFIEIVEGSNKIVRLDL